MLSLKIADFNDLSPGHYGILEPEFERCKVISPNDIDAIIIPGLAFDECKRRLGYGGGYYDRFITGVRNDCTRVAVCFDFQVLEYIPTESHDQRMDILVTDKRIAL
jgi:5-formyltetrahydrofolate cyclo-ligase